MNGVRLTTTNVTGEPMANHANYFEKRKERLHLQMESTVRDNWDSQPFSPRLGKRELRVFVLFLFLLVSGVGRGLWLWHSLDFSLNFFDIEHLL